MAVVGVRSVVDNRLTKDETNHNTTEKLIKI